MDRNQSQFYVDDEENHTISFSNLVTDTDSKQLKKSGADEMGCRSATLKTVRILVVCGFVIFVIVGVSVGGYEIAKHRSEESITASTSVRSFCQPSSIKDANELFLELTLLAGMDRLVNETEAKTLERAVMDGYNEASGGCNDDYERWIYGMYILPQTDNLYTPSL
jgi:hypothetical protein